MSAACGLLGVCVAPDALAQSAVGDQSATTLQEVVVTAQRRAENLQEVPLSVQAIDEKTLTQTGTRDFHDLALMMPGVDVTSIQPGNAVITIRGVAPIGAVENGGTPTTAVYLDGVPITGTISGGYANSPEPQINDTARVEVLKGPQGTLYGDSAMGGAIKFLSNQPDATGFSGHANIEAATTEDAAGSSAANATVNVPLISNILALRTSASYRDDGGYIDNVSPYTRQVDGENVNVYKSGATRIALGFTPDDTLTITPAFLYQGYHSTTRPYSSLPISGPPAAVGAGPQPPFWMTSFLQPYQAMVPQPEPTTDTFYLGTTNIEKHFAGVTLTSITGFFKRKDDVYTDNTAFTLGALNGTPVYPAVSTLPTDRFVIENDAQLTEEVRLASNNTTAPFQWTLGVYFNHQAFYGTQTLNAPGLTENLVKEFGAGASMQTFFPSALPNDQLFVTYTDNTQRQIATFGEASYKITDAVKVTAGARVFRLTEQEYGNFNGYFNGGSSELGPLEQTFSGVDPRFVVDYQITTENMLYASAAKGFRPGVLNGPVPQSLCGEDLAKLGYSKAPAAANPDSLWNYEIGSKNEWLEGRLRVNAAAYEMIWSNIQLSLLLPSCQFSFEANAGTGRIRGGEISVDAELMKGLTVGGSYNYINAVLTEVEPDVEFRVGDELPFAPKYMATAYAQYSQQFTDTVRGIARIDYMRRGDGVRDASINSYLPWYIYSGWDNVNASVGADWGQYEARLFVRNAFNKDWILDEINYWGQWRDARARPRTIGLNLGMKF
jgi:outer membrane receptor protein involved in Fe transport